MVEPYLPHPSTRRLLVRRKSAIFERRTTIPHTSENRFREWVRAKDIPGRDAQHIRKCEHRPIRSVNRTATLTIKNTNFPQTWST